MDDFLKGKLQAIVSQHTGELALFDYQSPRSVNAVLYSLALADRVTKDEVITYLKELASQNANISEEMLTKAIVDFGNMYNAFQTALNAQYIKLEEAVGGVLKA